MSIYEQEISAKFLSYGVEVTQKDPKTEIKSTKLVDYNSFFKAINKNIILQTGLIPPGIRYFSRYHGQVIAMIEAPPSIEEMKYNQKRGEKNDIIEGRIPVPGLLIGACLNEGHGVTNANVWMLKTSIKTLDDSVYHCPLGNTYKRCTPGSCNFCWGNTHKMWRNIKEVYQLRSLVNIFYSSKFNADLRPCYKVPSELSTEKLESIADLWRYIKNKDQFPTTVLMEAGTFKSAIKTLENKNKDFGDLPY